MTPTSTSHLYERSELAVLNLIEHPVLVTTCRGELIWCNQGAIEFVVEFWGVRLRKGQRIDEVTTLEIPGTFEGSEDGWVAVPSGEIASRPGQRSPVGRIFSRPVRDDHGEPDCVITIVQDEKLAVVREPGLNIALENVHTGVTITSLEPDFPLVEVNRAFCEMTGYSAEELIGTNCRFLQDGLDQGDQLEILREALRTQSRATVTLKNRRKNGEIFYNRLQICPVFDADGELIEYVGLQTDVTESVALEEALQSSKRLEALGRMSAGLAHDFNNDLFVILQSSQMALESLDEDTDVRGNIAEILEAADHASRLVQRMLDLGSSGAPDLRARNLGQLLDDITPMMRAMIGAKGELDIARTTDASLYVLLDQLEFERILLNLVSNGVDAIDSGGRIDVRLGVEGLFGVITVTDNGRGMDEKLQRDVFKPFFSTKGDNGTGLGLASCRQIMTSFGGTITLESEPGVGTTFRLELPLIDGTDGATLDVAAAPR